MRIKAYAKVNLALDVVGKREDGYHLLKMIMQRIDLYDVIDVEEHFKDEIVLSCNKPYIPTDERNLCYKAAALFKKHFNINRGVKINIKKNIPMSAGLAGGSTDAAAVLVAMNKIFNTKQNEENLMELGVKIGADVPYCIKSGTALCEGVGEVITSLKAFDNEILVLVKPAFGVSTKEVYGALDINKINRHPNIDAIVKAMESHDLEYICRNMRNVLENVTLKKHRLIKDIKDDMIKYGAMGSMMSGSGPTVFAFFDDMVKAQFCFEKMKEKYKDVYITRTL